MDIPRGHAAAPLTPSDFLDFISTYFKAEYAPIRSFWSTATAIPRHIPRWIAMGHELTPLSFRPANAQAQKDLESLDGFTRRWGLDPGFVKGIVVRFAKYEVHERLERKLYESARLDLMVRKALKEKHLIDSLWPSPAPRNLPPELLQQGVQVRRWYGDMFAKYFRVLHSLEHFELRPEVDARIKSSGTLMLVPFVDHLVVGEVSPIVPIVAQGAGFSSARAIQGGRRGGSYGEPGRFDIRFDAPAEVVDTYTKSMVRQCQCLRCGTKRDVQVVVSIDPSPHGALRGEKSASKEEKRSNMGGQKRTTANTSQKYSAGYDMPGSHRRPNHPEPAPPNEPLSAATETKKQCSRCTFLNHADLTVCELCQANLPEATIQISHSPAPIGISHTHSSSEPLPANKMEASHHSSKSTDERPPLPNRQSLSSTLLSIFPFSQAQQQEHHARLPPAQADTAPPSCQPQPEMKQTSRPTSSSSTTTKPAPKSILKKPKTTPNTDPETPSTIAPPTSHEPLHASHHHHPKTSESHNSNTAATTPPQTPLSRAPEMTLMPLTPPPSSRTRHLPGLPRNLMDEYIPPSPGYLPEDGEVEEGAGWGDIMRSGHDGGERRSEKGDGRTRNGEEEDEEEEMGGMVDLDAVAREEADVWGEREDD